MAHLNTVLLNGWISNEPEVLRDENGTYREAAMLVRVVVGKYSDGHLPSVEGEFDIIVKTKNPIMVKQISTYKFRDVIELKGFLATKHVYKMRTCTHCGTPKPKEECTAVHLFITPIYMKKRTTGVPEDKYSGYLASLLELSNWGMWLGNLTRDPVIGKNKRDVYVCQYQLAINRKYKVKEDNLNDKTDYPWVKTFGDQAIKDYYNLQKGSLVLVEGNLMSVFDRKQKDICPHCNKEFEWLNESLEIRGKWVEYMRDTKNPETESVPESFYAQADKECEMIRNDVKPLTPEGE